LFLDWMFPLGFGFCFVFLTSGVACAVSETLDQ